MNRYLVTFSEFRSENERQDIINSIKQLGGWARINDYTYCIKCNHSSTVSVRESILGNKNVKCRLFVLNISHSAWASYGLPSEVSAWLKEKE